MVLLPHDQLPQLFQESHKARLIICSLFILTTFHSTLSTLQSDSLQMIVYFTGYNDTALLQQDIHSLQIWSQDWLMNFNALKCYSMSVTLSKNSIDTTHYLNGIPCQLSIIVNTSQGIII